VKPNADRRLRAPLGPHGLRRARTAAFTLLELLIVLVVVALVASLAIPAFFERSEVTLDNACRLLAEDLRAAQNRAAYLRTEIRVQFSADGDGYTVVDAQGIPVEAPGGEGLFVRSYERDAVFEGVSIARVECGAMRRIAYDEHGRATQGGRILLTYHDDSRLVEVVGGDGRIRVAGLARPWIDNGY
jgi:prepilin-type N-terminal cleavage/methylation domain-containing protein